MQRSNRQHSLKARISDWISLIRPANSVMVGFAVVVGIAVSSPPGSQIRDIVSIRSLFGFVTGFSISSFSMITNDLYDYEVDKINQPNRAVASGRISLGAVKIYSIPFLLVGLVASLFLSPANLAIAAVFALIGWYYNYHGKKLGIYGNALVALSLAIPYIFGSVAIGIYALNLAYLLAVTSFLAGMGREVLKGISDIQGDRIRNIRSVAISKGARAAKVAAASMFILAVISSSFPVLAGLLGSGLAVYLVLVIITDGVFCYLALKTLKIKVELESLRLKGIALAGMMLGLLTYLLAGLAR
jgi:geranylgeranylglycerol-phosphate geranylgeranyltransferase